MMQLDDVLAGTWHAKDGLADPNGVVMGYVNGARRLGVKLFADTTVTAIETRGGKVSAVVTNRGRLETPRVVECGWAVGGSDRADGGPRSSDRSDPPPVVDDNAAARNPARTFHS